MSRLRPRDLLRLATVGLRTRRLRAALSVLGISIGIASLVAVLAISETSKADLLERIERLGTNLLTVGPGTVIRKACYFNGYRARGGVIETGPVTLGADVFVGEQTVLDIGTAMGDGAQLGHASSLHAGQAVPAGACWHGSPARPADAGYDYRTAGAAHIGRLRRIWYGGIRLAGDEPRLLEFIERGDDPGLVGPDRVRERGLGPRRVPVERVEHDVAPHRHPVPGEHWQFGRDEHPGEGLQHRREVAPGAAVSWHAF